MISHHRFAPTSEIRTLDSLPISILGTSPLLDLYGLENARSLMGCTNIWVTRHSSERYEMVKLIGPSIEADSSLHSLLIYSEKNSHQRPVLLVRWQNSTLLCARLSVQQEEDGCTYMIGMLFSGPFELTARLEGVLDGLRCSLQALIIREVYWQRMTAIQGADTQPIACSSCHRIHTTEHGWLNWDDLRYLKTGHGTTHTFCDKCAIAIYGDVLHDHL